MKGLLGGAFWGLVLGGGAVVIGSLNTAQPAGVAPPQAPQTDMAMSPSPDVVEDPALALPEGDGENQRPAPQSVAEPDTPEIAPEAETATLPQPETDTPEVALNDAPDAADAPDIATAVNEALTLDIPLPLEPAPGQTTAPEADTMPLATPSAGSVTADLSEPETSLAPDMAGSMEEPVLPNPQSVAPQSPVVEDDLVVSTTPSAPADADADDVVIVEEGETVETTETGFTDSEAPRETERETEDSRTVSDGDETEIAATPGTPLATADDQEPPTAADDGLDDDPQTEVAGDELDTADLPDQPDESPNDDEMALDELPDATGAEDGETTDNGETPARPTVVSILDVETAPALPGGAADVTVRRPADEAAPEPDATDVAPEPETDPDAHAFVRFAAEFENAEDKPLMSIVLLDEGNLRDAPRLLAGIPFPVTVVVDAGRPDAADRLAAYRAEGIEVGVRARIPLAAQATDIEVALEAAFAALPETVVLVDPGDGNLQSDRAVTEMAVASLADRGRGLVTMPKGFNAALQVATDEDVPAGVFYRDLDGEGQDARVIRRFMDQAAFKARQESGVVLLGRVRADTISALNLWGNANRAGQVAMAPVTAVLGQ